MKLLAAADIHLGRPPARVPADWARRYSSRAAFENLVTAAINEEADAVLLAGDVADRENAFYEAYGVLQRSVDRLRENGIPLIAVAGNHDTQILPELADAVQDPGAFRLLGRGGTWESADLDCRDGNRVRIWGWSFPRSDYGGNPLADFPDPVADRPATVLGLLHADRGAAGGNYAPVLQADLDATNVRPWILGHIHLPDPIVPNATSCYPGSLQALDPTEIGLHGALWITDGGNAPILERRRMGGLRYERVELDAAGILGQGAMVSELKVRTTEIQQQDSACRAVSARIRVTGETEVNPADLRRWVAGDDQDIEIPVADDLVLHPEQIDVDVRPPLDLVSLARGRDTTALLARMLQNMESGEHDELVTELQAAARERLQQVDRANAFIPLAGTEHAEDGDGARRILLRQGYVLLRELCRQREDGS